jgi:TonB family protein
MEELRLVPFSEYHIDCRILEVEPGASLEEIRQAYRDQTKVWHPDRFSNDLRLQKKAEEKTKQINLAYRRLCGLSPYEQPVSSPAIPESSSQWIAVIMLRQWLRNSVTVISKPFRLLIRKVVNISNSVFQWCRRERRALAIATSAFVLGFAFGVWLLPRDSETWVKISSLLQKTIKKNGMAQAAVAQASAAPTVLSQTGIVATSSPETGASVPPSFFGTSSNPPMTGVSADGFPLEANVTTTPFWVGDGQVTGKTLTQYASAWEKHWLKIFGGGDDPERTARGNYIPISFVPHQNTFYYALPYNDVEQGHFKPEEPNVVLLSKQIQGEPDHDIARQQPEESIRKRPAHPAAVEPSHASAPTDQSGMLSSAVAPEKELAERKKPANPAASKPVQGHRAPTESVMRASAKAVTTYAPRPDYPEEARSRRIAGSGVCVVSVDPYTGSVTNASMAQSTGNQLLDKSVLRTLRTWKFKPGTVSQVSIPVEFTTEAENP